MIRYAFVTTILLAVISCATTASAQQANNQILQSYVLQGKDANRMQQELTNKSKVLVDACSEALQLDEGQVEQLRFACRGDVMRIMQEITELDIHTKHVDMQEMGRNQEEMQKIWPLVMPARSRIDEGLHSKGSLFEKSLKTILTADQLVNFEKQNQEKQTRLIVATTKLTLLEFEKQVPLTADQRNRIIKLVEESPKPKLVSEGMAYYLGIVVLSKLSEEKVREILNEEQFKTFKKTFQNAQRFGGFEW
jgi:hypothetical protein